MGEAEKPGDCVKVAIRMRPLSSKELGNNESSIVELKENISPDGNGSVDITDPESKEKPAEFAFDIVFGTKVLQQTVYEAIGLPALNSMFSGYNGTIFAYGQTGSGKSWSMMGGPGDLKGIIPRVNEELFVKVDSLVAEVSTRRFLVMCSFFEIYNEIIFDLLNPSQDKGKLGAGLQVKEHPVLGIYVKDLQEIVVSDAAKLGLLMDSGTKNRAVSSTLMNSVSSRSHSIFTIKVHQKDEEDKSRNVFAKLNLVDLAGSERQKGTGASGQTLKEGANINKSLSALGNVINALVENANGKKVFVPFRNSKLTRVLQESLGGNSLCTMLAALSPAACNFEETLSTLRYANRAKAIKVSATKNEEASQISRLNAEIEELKKKLAQGGGAEGGGGGGGGLMAEEERKEMQAKFQAQLAEMQQMVNSTWEEKAKFSQDQEQQMAQAMEGHKRQQREMQQERKKRLRLFQDQNDLELSIRGLISTLQSLTSSSSSSAAAAAGAEGGGDAAAAPPPPAYEGPCASLRSTELPGKWLKSVASITTLSDSLKQQHTMAMLFHSSLGEDLKLWVEGEEGNDAGMARTGARRASSKLETLKRECSKLASLESEAHQKVADFAAQVAEVLHEWQEGGKPAALAELRAIQEESAADGEGEEKTPEEVAKQQQDSGPTREELNIEDVGEILQILSRQAAQRAGEFVSLGSLEVSSTSSLVVKAVGLTPGHPAGPEVDILRMLAEGAEHDDNGSLISAAPPGGRAATAGSQAESTANKEDKPLHEWTPEDADDSVQGTEVVLSQIVSWDTLNKKRTPEELLTRPPPKFVHDVALLVNAATGYPPNISEDWPDSREGKLEVLQGIADAVQTTLGLQSIEFNPSDVLKGKEVPKTLRLLQLLAMAASRESGGKCGPNGGASASQQKKAGLTKASDLAQVLEAIGNCLHAAMDLQVARRDGGDGHCSPTRQMESHYRNLQERLRDEEEQQKVIEGKIAELKKQVADSKALLAERNAQLEDVRNAEVHTKQRKQELQQQLADLRTGLLKRAAECDGNPQVSQLRSELSDISSRQGDVSQSKARLSDEVKKLQQQQVETETSLERKDMELKRLRLRLADAAPIVQDEELLELQAEKQRWDMQVATLEEQMKLMGEADDMERQKENSIMETLKLQESKHQDVQMQLQVIIEERDGLREGMELLWKEKTDVDEQLEDVSMGYTGLTERLEDKREESRELEEQIMQYEALMEMMQENFQKARTSPPTNGHAATNGHGEDALPPPCGGDGDGAPPPPPPPADESGSSHYSDDDFEEPDDDAEEEEEE